jgi:hypothetical protein
MSFVPLWNLELGICLGFGIWCLEFAFPFGAWNLFGIWDLEFGIFPLVRLPLDLNDQRP